ncbi:hypothetical protein QBA54_37980 [Streptomyces sp. B21-108]|uniref:hypothetical protein n=1 Tax=Streptomyces sp. B21-108 TaxID=3039419 RepID=UPI002FF24F40
MGLSRRWVPRYRGTHRDPPHRRAYPAADRLPVADELHGQRVPDPYRWLEADEDEACERWLAEQDRLFAAHARSWSKRRAPGERHGSGASQPPMKRPPGTRTQP